MEKPTDYIYVPIPVDLYAELIRRSGRSNVSIYIENQIRDFLDMTEGDPAIWAVEYVERHANELDDQFEESFGSATRGYQWQSIFLPNGSQVRMRYRGSETYGEIRHQKLFLNDEAVSPSEFAKKVANNTSRNAWRDIYVQFPGDADWKFADGLRRTAKNQ